MDESFELSSESFLDFESHEGLSNVTRTDFFDARGFSQNTARATRNSTALVRRVNNRRHGKSIPSRFKQISSDTFPIIVTNLVAAVISVYAYETLVKSYSPQALLYLGPGFTVFIINVLSQVLGSLIKQSLSSKLDVVRWHFASNNSGFPVTTFLGLSAATSYFGVLDLARVKGTQGPNNILFCS